MAKKNKNKKDKKGKKPTPEQREAKKNRKAENRQVKKDVKREVKKQKQIQKGASDIAERDVSKGIEIGKQVAPDVTDEDFLDRLDPEVRSEDVQTAIDRYDENRNRALEDSPEFKEALDLLRQRATDGFTPQEREALTGQARQALNSTLRTGLDAANAYNLSRGITGGFQAGAFNPVLIDAAQQRRGIENDVRAAQIARQDTALGQFTGTVADRDQNRVRNVFDIDTQQAELVNRDRDFRTDIGKYNADQRAKEIAARVSRNATGIGLVQDERDSINRSITSEEQLRRSQANLERLLGSVA